VKEPHVGSTWVSVVGTRGTRAGQARHDRARRGVVVLVHGGGVNGACARVSGRVDATETSRPPGGPGRPAAWRTRPSVWPRAGPDRGSQGPAPAPGRTWRACHLSLGQRPGTWRPGGGGAARIPCRRRPPWSTETSELGERVETNVPRAKRGWVDVYSTRVPASTSSARGKESWRASYDDHEISRRRCVSCRVATIISYNFFNKYGTSSTKPEWPPQTTVSNLQH
jgi:hypothetical protein